MCGADPPSSASRRRPPAHRRHDVHRPTSLNAWATMLRWNRQSLNQHGPRSAIEGTRGYPENWADLAVSMMKRSIEAMIISDRGESGKLAIEIENDDDEVDRLYAKVQADILALVEEDRYRAVRGTYLLWAAHNLERVADRATNIAERAIFMSTGVIVGGNAEAQAAVGG